QINSKLQITMFKPLGGIGDWKLRIVIYPDKIIGTSFVICFLLLGFSGLVGFVIEYCDLS
ncbi:MAG: hypothetical protein ABIJ40_05510, partial [Bacteroidota bacterium]